MNDADKRKLARADLNSPYRPFPRRGMWVAYAVIVVLMWCSVFTVPFINYRDEIAAATQLAMFETASPTPTATYTLGPSVTPSVTPTPTFSVPTPTPRAHIDMVVAARSVRRDEILTAQDLDTVYIPADAAARGGYTDVRDVIGRQTSADLLPGQPILYTTLNIPPEFPDVRATATAFYVIERATAAVAQPGGALPTPTVSRTFYRFVAAYDLPAGTIITQDDVQLRPFEAEPIPEFAGFFTGAMVGRVAQIDLPRGYPINETLLTTDFSPMPEDDGTACIVTAAAAVPVAAELDGVVDGFVRPETPLFVVDIAEDRYWELTTADGYSIGWVDGTDALLTTEGDCSAYRVN